jgi:transposase
VLIPVQITLDEKELLLGWMKDGVSHLIRSRAHSILLNSQGKSAHAIAQMLFRDEDIVRGWIAGFKKTRISSLFDQYRGNTNAKKLSPTQQAEIVDVLGKPPADQGIPKEFWQVKNLKKYMKAEFGVVYESVRSYHFLFRVSGFSWKLPDKFDVSRDDAFVAQRIKEIREEITPFMTDDSWVVITADEARMVWESESRRAWLKTGEKTILKVHREGQYQSFFGGLNLKSKKCHLFQLSWQNQEEIIKVLKKLVAYYPDKKICIIWDNAHWHKGKELRVELGEGKSLARLHLINLPPYAPDTNPQEHVWKYAKDHIAHQPTTSFKQKINNFKLAVIHRTFNYSI